MFLGELTDCQPLHEDLQFRIIGKSLSLQAKGLDSGLRPNLFVANYALMYYFIRFFKKKSRHHFVGSLNVYAYMNDDNTRAFINLRMNVAGVRPYPNVDDNNNLIPSEAVRMTADKYDNKKLHKLKYMLYRYVWENIENEDMVEQEKLVKDSFAIYLSDLHDDLCDMNLIIDGETLNPVVIKETFAKKKKSKKLAERRREVEYLFNEEKVPRVDWEHPAMKLDKLLDSKTPLPRELVYLPPTAEASISEERSREASPMHT